ncbi:PLP-dependent aminotransferase family protein [Herbivorax sp. ANBcel31]|uniref:MocR-like pyridoxine biosynthesis transcription factor PdxR n=1 Tax=Herbivorax sp. ANBcel31 TaxID=3069754 RepID=UPI0027AF555F|nr:PLP-dependent aminotransferase family protein [Herbivorax sp. ANBcel31]MDQ2085625.1 PLP-dependent aminotransferase family protein [Herbivorax sp. ANBcel31]
MVIKMLELFKSIKLNKVSNIPLYMQLFNTISSMIEEGTLLSQTKLPSVRQMSSLLKVNAVTVVNCYKQLELKGYVYTKKASGTYVSAVFPPVNKKNYLDKNVILDEIYPGDDISVLNNGKIKFDENTINFASATPSSNLFPVEHFKLVLNEVLDRDMGNAFNYQESQGYHPLRSSIKNLSKTYNVNCSEDNIIIISGTQQGIDIISKTLLKDGDYVITESPTYRGAIAVFKSRGAKIADVDLEEDGLNLNLLEYHLKKYRPKLIYTIPAFQNPTGISYSKNKRKELVMLAEKYDTYIIEDGYVSELDFENKNFKPIIFYDKSERVIYLKSFSKIFMPGLRFGFMIVPPHLKKHILGAKHATDISTSGLIQRTFDLYIRKGLWNKHFYSMYETYKNRYIRLVNSLDKNNPGNLKYKNPGGGLNIWISLPYGFMVNSLLEYTASKNIVFSPGRIFYSNTPTTLNNIRLSFAAVSEDKIEAGVEKLCKLISEY